MSEKLSEELKEVCDYCRKPSTFWAMVFHFHVAFCDDCKAELKRELK